MPGAAFHSNYWANANPSTVVDPVVPGVAGYPAWQTSVILGGGFGATQIAWEWIQRKRKEPARGDR